MSFIRCRDKSPVKKLNTLRESKKQDRLGKNPGDSVALNWSMKLAANEDVEKVLVGLTEHMNDQQRAVFADKLKRYVQKPDRDLILAVEGNRLLGLICVIDQADLPSSLSSQPVNDLSEMASVTQLFVHQSVRRSGIGGSLVQKGEQWARERGRAGLWLITHRQVSWYERHFGYREVDRVRVNGVEKTVMAREF
jgi:GNAT superfamily N-acetyltransferase